MNLNDGRVFLHIVGSTQTRVGKGDKLGVGIVLLMKV